MMKECESDNNIKIYNILYTKYIDALYSLHVVLAKNDILHQKYFLKYNRMLKDIPLTSIIKLSNPKDILKILCIKLSPSFLIFIKKIFNK